MLGAIWKTQSGALRRSAAGNSMGLDRPRRGDRRGARNRLAVVALWPLAVALGVPAAAPAETAMPAEIGVPAVRDAIEVRLTELEVEVSDRGGRPLTGLEREQFELRLDGRRVAVTHFVPARPADEAAGESVAEAMGGAAPGGAPSARATPDRGPRSLLVYVERAFLEPGDLAPAAPALAGFLERLPAGDRVWVADSDQTLTLHGPFDGVEAAAALTAVLSEPGHGRLGTEFEAILRGIERASEEGMFYMPARDRAAAPRALLSQIGAFAAQAHRDLRAAAGRLRLAVEAMAGLEGRREVLFVGRLPVAAGRSLVGAWQQALGRFSAFSAAATGPGPGAGASGTAGSAAEPAVIDLSASPDELDAGRLFDEVAARGAQLGVMLHAVDAVGGRPGAARATAGGGGALSLGGSTATGAASEADSGLHDSDGLRRLAEGTGGLYLPAGSLAVDLARVAGGRAGLYRLGFEPPAGEEGSVYRVEVKVRGQRRAALRYRRHHQVQGPAVEAAERLKAALLLGATVNPLDAELEVGQAVPAADGPRLAVKVRVPFARLALVADGRFHGGRLSLFAAAHGPERPAAAVWTAALPVRVANEELFTALGRWVEGALEVPVDPGARALAVGIRDDIGGVLSVLLAPAPAGRPAGSP